MPVDVVTMMPPYSNNGTNESDIELLVSLPAADMDDLFQGYDVALTQLAAVFCVLFILLGVPGNFITILALARCKKVGQKLAIWKLFAWLSNQRHSH